MLQDGYTSYVPEKAHSGKLHAIFVDEAHLLLAWKGFQKSVEEMREKIRPDGVDCPVIEVTATGPPKLERDTGNICGMINWNTYRFSTTRHNIACELQSVHSAAQVPSAVANVLLHLTKKHAKYIVYSKCIANAG